MTEEVSGGRPNPTKPDKTGSWINNHGEELGAVVNAVNAWLVTNGRDDKVRVRGGWDAEPSWSSYSEANNWMHGYDDRTTYSITANYSADGCPSAVVYNSTSNGSCNNGWTQFSLWHLSRFHYASEYPQIYYESQARQWMRLEEYGNHVRGQSLYFWGAMGGDGTNNNTAHKAHAALWDELNNPGAGHSPNHAAQGSIVNATLQRALSSTLPHDH